MTVKKEDFFGIIESRVGQPIEDNTIFFEDIEIDGLDAFSLMDEVAKYYNLNMDGYIPTDYHFEERQIANPFRFIKNIFGAKKNIKTFTALHLYEVVKKGKWFNPPTLPE